LSPSDMMISPLPSTHSTVSKSKVVRLVQDDDKAPPISVRVSVGTSALPHLIDIFHRRHVDTEGKAFIDAQTKEEITEAYLQQRLEVILKPLDVCLCQKSELVEVNASIVNDDEQGADNYVSFRMHHAALTENLCLAVARAFKTEGLRMIRWDYSVMPSGVPFLDMKNADLDAPIDVVLAHSYDLIPVTVSLTLSEFGEDKERNLPIVKSLEMLFYKHVSVAAVFRIALITLYQNPSIFSRELEFLDPLQQPIDEPASLTLQQCITRCGFVELPEGMTSYHLAVNDGIPVPVSYTNGDISSSCVIVLPPSGTTVDVLLSKAFTTMKLPGKIDEYSLCCKSGAALLDMSSKVERHHVNNGLMITSKQCLFSVTVNDSYMAGFVEDVRPSVASLVDTLGLPAETRICFNDVIVINSLTPLVRNGMYYVVDDHAGSKFSIQDITLPNDDRVNLPVSNACTASELLEVLALMYPSSKSPAESDEDQIPALMDNTDCILADNLTAEDFPRTPLRYCFV